MSIFFHNEDVDLPELNFDLLKKMFKRELRINKAKLGEINFIFCSDTFLLDMNIKFLQHDYFTDVITFDYSEGVLVSGDVYISVDRVLNNSLTFEQNYDIELVRVISHGLLHLLKYNDKKPDEIAMMRNMEDRLIKSYIS